MYVVIFRATADALDARYAELAESLRQRALSSFGCLEFVAVSEGDQEIALSYWPDLESIRRWREDAEHQTAQALGRDVWYSHYSVEIAEIHRQYGKPSRQPGSQSGSQASRDHRHQETSAI